SRYIYEHLFLASVSFDDVPSERKFRLVRSRTPPGEPAVELPTRRPFDDPGGSFYYRFVQSEDTPLAKTHMPYALNKERLARYRELFVTPDFTVPSLPGYGPDDAANPFKTFAAI